MPRFAANLTMLYNELPFLERFGAAARDGFEAVEFLFPYAFDAAAVADAARGAGVRIVLHNLPGGDWDAGERGIACLPDRVDEFRAGVERAIEYAAALGVPQLNCLAGKLPADADAARRTLRDNLRWAAQRLAAHGIRLLLEPINGYDIPGFAVQRSAQAIELLDEVADANVYLQYDIYHMQRMEGELAATLERLLERIAHIQLADNPGRHEPGTGEINYPFLFRHLDRIGYAGWIGCEYKPSTTTSAGLGWMRDAR
ncbi:hydroxypyruvate isomerase [mine drainage metagenome]|jgi:hydroxypyruvate isomerase|uniref:Hydroxypyruvate isomerase n=1 Tax=mine drainage metagenome TaxID=410659 RepID=A0A1J5QYT3_9ZZZZ